MKILAVVQVFWIMFQVIVRTARRMDVTQLELGTTAFSVCAVFTYSRLFKKPKGVQIAVALAECDRDDALAFLNTQRDSSGNRRSQMIRFMPQFFGLKSSTSPSPRKGPVSNDAFDNDYHLAGVIMGAVIFGSIHVAGWRLTFPTEIEKTFWRTASIVLTGLPPTMFIPAILRLYLHIRGLSWRFIRWWDVLSGTLYVIARLFMLVEIFRTLGFLHPRAFISTWATNIPHVA